MKPHALLIVAIAFLSAPLPAIANGTHESQAMKMAAKDAQLHHAKGTVNKINPDGSVNISHGPVNSLGWPGMTMNFQLQDKALLKGVNPGQRVDFEIARQADGSYAISGIAPTK